MPLPARPRARTAALAAACLLAAGAPTAYAAFGGDPAPAATVAAAPGSRPYVETRLLFGTQRPDGGPDVTDEQFTAFVDGEVTPRFPAGLTVRQGRGQWRDAAGRIVRERSYELVLLYPAADAVAGGREVERIRAAYVRAFGQESVGRADDRVGVDF